MTLFRAGWIGTILLAAGVAWGGGWQEDFDKAAAEAREQDKYILVDFSGSDWCGWCIKLEREVFSQEAFKKYADENLVLALLDFPRRKEQSPALKKQNAKLMDRYGIEGFPTVLVLDPNGHLVARTGYRPGGPDAYVKYIQELIVRHKEDKE